MHSNARQWRAHSWTIVLLLFIQLTIKFILLHKIYVIFALYMFLRMMMNMLGMFSHNTFIMILRSLVFSSILMLISRR